MPAINSQIATQPQTTVESVSNSPMLQAALIEIVNDHDLVNQDTTFLHHKVLNYAFSYAGSDTPRSSWQISPNDIYDSFPSRPIDKINIPEVKNIESSFVCNYYTKDERIRKVER